MEREYEQIQAQPEAGRAQRRRGGIGFISPGMLTPRGPKGVKLQPVQAARPSISAAVARKGSGERQAVERDARAPARR